MDPLPTASFLLALMSTIFISSGSADQRNLTAEPGQDITLPCRAHDSGLILVVIWRRTDLGSAYVLLYRNAKLDLENQHPSFKNRVDLQDRQLKNGDMSLVLRNVTTEDGGTYHCRVVQTPTNSGMKTVVIINLDVLPPPGEPKGGTKDGYVALVVGLVVGALVLVIVTVGGYTIYKKYFRPKPNQSPEPLESLMGQNQPAEQNPP